MPASAISTDALLTHTPVRPPPAARQPQRKNGIRARRALLLLELARSLLAQLRAGRLAVPLSERGLEELRRRAASDPMRHATRRTGKDETAASARIAARGYTEPILRAEPIGPERCARPGTSAACLGLRQQESFDPEVSRGRCSPSLCRTSTRTSLVMDREIARAARGDRAFGPPPHRADRQEGPAARPRVTRTPRRRAMVPWPRRTSGRGSQGVHPGS